MQKNHAVCMLMMATSFRLRWPNISKHHGTHPPTIPETAAYFREQQIAAVIFPVDAERETGYRRYKNEEVAELVADHNDILIPFASIDPWKGKMGCGKPDALFGILALRDSNSTRPFRVSIQMTQWPIRYMKRLQKKALSGCSILARQA